VIVSVLKDQQQGPPARFVSTSL